ncbi:MAG: hypothetical protein BWZ02_01731 [Lentisphaerae bacterium ADurb.BinA184]|nr:MAG: hypothetical protein BWZ02_01731 [Lentisphaerae bacterium ADurb.BinA184]
MNTPVNTLEAYRRRTVVFSSAGKWLYPLFELEAFLRKTRTPRASLCVHDKVIGKAAALLLARLGIRRVLADVLSQSGRQVLDAHGIRYRAGEVVERISCQTEEMLLEVSDVEEAHRLVLARIEALRPGSVIQPPPELRQPPSSGPA